jgi:hypothetical protein
VEIPPEAIPRKTSLASRRMRFLVTAPPAALPSATINSGGSPGLVYATHGPCKTRTPDCLIRLKRLLRFFRTTVCCWASDGQAMPTLGPAPLQHVPPVCGAHPLPEAVTFFSLAAVWLVGPLHGLSPLEEISKVSIVFVLPILVKKAMSPPGFRFGDFGGYLFLWGTGGARKNPRGVARGTAEPWVAARDGHSPGAVGVPLRRLSPVPSCSVGALCRFARIPGLPASMDGSVPIGDPA